MIIIKCNLFLMSYIMFFSNVTICLPLKRKSVLFDRRPINLRHLQVKKFSWSHLRQVSSKDVFVQRTPPPFLPRVRGRKEEWVMHMSVVLYSLVRAKSSFNLSLSGKTCLSKHSNPPLELDVLMRGERGKAQRERGDKGRIFYPKNLNS